jgi:hypothetical protein
VKDIGVRINGYLYSICEPKGGIDINARYGYNQETNRFAYQEEIAFEGQILRRYIIRATRYFKDRTEGKTVNNPFYKP